MTIAFLYIDLILVPVSTAVLDDQVVGDPVSLQCNTTTMASIHSQVEIMWMRNNKMITNNDRITVTDTIRNNSHTSTLHFSYLTEDDDGLYTCVVKIPGTESETMSQSLELGNFSGKSKLSLRLHMKCQAIMY